MSETLVKQHLLNGGGYWVPMIPTYFSRQFIGRDWTIFCPLDWNAPDVPVN